MPWSVDWRVFVGGKDLTAKMLPFLIDIAVEDKDGEASDTCSLTFDDTGGQVRLPRDGAPVRVWLQGTPVFTGVVDSVRSQGSRGGGRVLRVGAKGFDSRGPAKEPQHFHRDDATLQEFLGKAAENAGFSLKIDPGLGAIMRDYWVADRESFLHLGRRLAREFFATFKLRGNEAVFVPRGGDPGLPVVTGTVGETEPGTVISWSIAPVTGRRTFTKAEVQFFDRKAAAFKTKDVEIDLGRDGPAAVNAIRSRAADEGQAGDIANARRDEAKDEGGEGSVTLDLTPQAQAEGRFLLSGARPGVDGLYRIASVSHRASRSGGATTTLSLKQPAGGAGTDTR